jgi:hypothetical protein
MSVSLFGYLIRFMGYGFMLYSFTKLRGYNKAFNLPLAASGVMLVITLADVYAKLGTFLYENLLIDSFSLPAGFEVAVGYTDDAFVFVFHACLFYAIRCIAKETEDEKISYNSVRNFAFIAFYYVIYLVTLLPIPALDEFKKYFSLPVILLYFACLVLNVVLLVSCYARICDESDVDMPFKKSRFAFINKLNEKEQKAADENAEYAKQKMEEICEKRRNKKKK